jgi:PAS domain S-box-containing protein
MTPPKSPRKSAKKKSAATEPDGEEVCRESEEKFRTLSRNVPGMIYRARSDWSVEIISGNEKICGYLSDEFTARKMKWSDLIHPDDRHQVIQEGSGLLHPPVTTIEQEYRILHKNGSIRWVSDHKTSVFRNDGGFAGIDGIVFDITDRRYAEEALRESEEKYRTLIEKANEAVIIAQDGVFAFANPSMSRLLGVPVDDLVGKPFVDFIWPDDRDFVATRYRQRVAGEDTPGTYDFRITGAGGRMRWVSISGAQIVWRGRPATLNLLTDITGRKQAEEALRESEEKFRILFTHMTAGSALHEIVYDRSQNPVDYRLLDVNPAYGRILGLKRENIIGKTSREVYSSDEPPFLDTYARVASTGKPEDFEVYFVPMKKHFAISVYSPGTGRFVTIFEDITERKRTEEKLRESEQKFREIFNNINDAIHLHDIAPDGSPGRFLDVNDAACRMLMISRDDLLSHSPLDFVTEYHNPPLEDVIRQLRTTGNATFETGHRRADGTVVPVEINAHAITLAGKTVVLSVIRDLTYRKKAEEEIRLSNMILKTQQEASPDGILIVDENAKILNVNQSFIRIWGIPGDLLSTRSDEPVLQYIAGQTADPAAFLSRVKSLYENREEKSLEDIPLKNGRVLKRYSAPMLGENNRYFGRVWYFHEITEYKQAEKALSESRQILQGILNTIPVRVFWKDKELTYLGCNTPFARDAGFEKPEDVIGRDDYSMGWRDQAELYRADDRAVIGSGKSKYMIEEPQTTPAGETIFLLTSKMPLLDARGDAIGILGTYLDITARKQAEAALRESRQLFSDIISFLPDPTFVINRDGRVIAWNRALENLSGVSAGDIIGKGDHAYSLWQYDKGRPVLIDLVLHKNQDAARLNYTDIHRDGNTITAQTEITHTATGKKIPLSLVASPLIDAQGKITGAIESMRDISRLKEAEAELARINRDLEKIIMERTQALSESERKYRTLFDKTKDAFLIIENNKFIDCNASALQMVGFSTKEELFQTHPSQLSPPTQPDGRSSFEKAEEMMATALRDGSHRFEWVHRRANGEDFWVEVSLTAIPIHDHNVIHTAWRDISDRKKAEKAVQDALSYTRSVIEANPDLMVVLDGKGSIIDVNAAAEILIGIPRVQLIGTSFLSLNYLVDDGTLPAIFSRLIKTGTLTHDVQVRQADGRITPLSVNATLIKGDDDENETRIIVAGHDITRQKKDEEAIRASLEEKVILLREVHHRVKNNLQIIISLTNLQMRQTTDPAVKQILAETQNRVRAMSLVHEKLFRSESLSHIDFADYTRFLATQLFSFYGTDTRKVRLDMSMGKIMVDINTAVPLGLLMNELVSNALKHAFPQGKEGTISISGGEEGNLITLVVRDDGIGIPEGFDWKNTSSLGMRLITSLVDQVDGTITLDRENGTAFTVTLKRNAGTGGTL